MTQIYANWGVSMSALGFVQGKSYSHIITSKHFESSSLKI